VDEDPHLGGLCLAILQYELIFRGNQSPVVLK